MRAILLLLLLIPLTVAQPDLGPVLKPVNDLAGDTLPPVLGQVYNLTGDDITSEDVRIFLNMNITKGDVGLVGLIVGSGRAEVQANIDVRVELRVISSDRIRAAIEGDNAYNMSAENATWLSDVYIPAEVFRASASAEVIAAFQKDQEAALANMIDNSLPELKVLSIKMEWKHVHPYEALSDVSLVEPPIVVELNAVVQYLRVESIPSLLDLYFTERTPSEEAAKESRDAYIERMKGENGDPLRSRDFFSAAAYTQLLNLSMQPGWLLDVHLRVPRGFSFEYTNTDVARFGAREIAFQVDATSEDDDVKGVMLASITHRRAVALALFVGFIAIGGLIQGPLGMAYQKWRIAKSS